MPQQGFVPSAAAAPAPSGMIPMGNGMVPMGAPAMPMGNNGSPMLNGMGMFNAPQQTVPNGGERWDRAGAGGVGFHTAQHALPCPGVR